MQRHQHYRLSNLQPGRTMNEIEVSMVARTPIPQIQQLTSCQHKETNSSEHECKNTNTTDIVTYILLMLSVEPSLWCK